jgi:hypothetical protein
VISHNLLYKNLHHIKSSGGFMSARQVLFFGISMAMAMSLCMSFAMTAINIGFGSNFISTCLSAWGIGFVVSLPFSFLVPPLIQKLMRRLGI